MGKLVSKQRKARHDEHKVQLVRKVVADRTDDRDMLRIVLFGKTGSGKSSTGNTILGKKDLTRFLGKHREQNSAVSNVIDTPGVCDVYRDAEEVLFEVSRCLCFASPGPHALLFVINAAARFTQEEYDAYAILRRLFADHLNKFVILVFTHCEEQGNNKEVLKNMHAKYGQQVDNAKNEGRNLPDLRNILTDVSDRIVIISNTADKDTNDRQVLELLDQIQQLSKSDNHTDHFQDPQTKRVAELQEQQLNEIRKQNPGMNQASAWAELQRRTEAAKKQSNTNAAMAAVCTGFLGLTLAAGTVTTGGAAAVLVGASAAGGALASKAKDGRCSIM